MSPRNPQRQDVFSSVPHVTTIFNCSGQPLANPNGVDFPPESITFSRFPGFGKAMVGCVQDQKVDDLSHGKATHLRVDSATAKSVAGPRCFCGVHFCWLCWQCECPRDDRPRSTSVGYGTWIRSKSWTQIYLTGVGPSQQSLRPQYCQFFRCSFKDKHDKLFCRRIA